MKKIELPIRLMQYMSEKGKVAFIDDFTSEKKEDTLLDGIKYVSKRVGNELCSLSNGERWYQTCSCVRRGNHLSVQLRNRKDGSSEEIKLSEFSLFQNFPVVIVTCYGFLKMFAPMCSNKLELALFIEEIRCFATEQREGWAWHSTAEEMISLAKFLYRCNPQKKPSALDEIED